ncbi:MAG TPA: ATP-binding cassette domain-containing protein [Acidimicrobiales bacterium]|nr:ATP-binding cassette domain-containing protein [Acidimicrobiales bacterium]
MIELRDVWVSYKDAKHPTLAGVDLHIGEGELALVVGPTGVGKSTLLGAMNGLVPHFTGGSLRGCVSVDGLDTRTHRPRDLADVVGFVGQDPQSGFVTDTVEEELAYSMEQLAVAPDVMRKRVEETMDLLGIAELHDRPLFELSGGQQQRVAIGAALTAHPRILVLDEPTSALDPVAAEDVLATVLRLVHDLSVTVVLAEHRLERVVQYADRIVEVLPGGTVKHGPPARMLSFTNVAPPVVELGRFAGWEPLPLSVRDARRHASPLRTRLDDLVMPLTARKPAKGPLLLRSCKVIVRYNSTVAVREVSLDLYAGEVVVLMGRNGSGKSSLLWALQGTGPRQGGSVLVGTSDPGSLSAERARALVGLVPQTSTDLLYLDTVAEECTQADKDAGLESGTTTRKLLDSLVPEIDDASHPRDLSEGQRLALVLAIQLAAAPKVILLDEPTRGLDYAAKRLLIDTIDRLAAEGRAVVISTHDVEFAAMTADRVVVMASGEMVADGPATDILVASPAFAPQVSKVLAPLPYLTVEQVKAALDGGR